MTKWMLAGGQSDVTLDAAWEMNQADEPPDAPPTDEEMDAMYAAFLAEGHGDA